MRRVVSLIGGGAKGMTYFIFGPEYNFPGNCYSEFVDLSALFYFLFHAQLRSALLCSTFCTTPDAAI